VNEKSIIDAISKFFIIIVLVYDCNLEKKLLGAINLASLFDEWHVFNDEINFFYYQIHIID
tara:strand:- start:302 stop:484 length:183 start_codon:yes stop_codon:yes gene_type:complete